MLTREELQGKWTQVKGSIRERWGQLTEEDLQAARGNAEQLVGVIQQKTGAARHEIEELLAGAVENGKSMVDDVSAAAKDYTRQAGRVLRDSRDMMGQRLEEGGEEMRKMVVSRPVESVITALGAGLALGVVVGLLLCSGNRRS